MSAAFSTLVARLRKDSFTKGASFVAIALICAALAVAVIGNISLLTRLDQFVQDWEIASVFAPFEAQDSDIVIVAIDENTLRSFAYRSPVDHKFVSDLLQKLAAHSPRVIGLDLLIDQPTEAEKDQALRQTIRSLKVPLIVSYIDSAATVSPEQKAFEDAMVPVGDRGFATLPTDQFDTARWIFPGSGLPGGHYVPGFARAVAAAAGVQTPAVQVPIVWRGRPRPDATNADPQPFAEFSALIAGLLPDAWFRNKVVLIGSDVTLVDRHRTPFSTVLPGDAGQLPGIVIQAHGISQLLHARASPIASWRTDFFIAFALALLGAGLGVVNFPLLPRIAAAIALIILFWLGGVALFHFHGPMIGLTAPSLSLVAGFGVLDSLSGRDARLQRKFIHSAFSRYVSPKLVELMVQDPSRMSLEGERRLMTYLFSDIQDFTTMSEGLDSKTLARLINAYLDGMTSLVLKHDGMVDKFIGDAVFAIFNAPVDLEDHAQKAVCCMLELDTFTESFRRQQNALGIPFGVTRIGVHTGVSVIGNFGSHSRFTYTAQGDAVNTAARLEGINKYFGTRLCVSDATRLLCKDIAFRPIASVILKGKTHTLDLWEPLHNGAYAPDFLNAYGVAFDQLKNRNPDAPELFEALLKNAPNDPCVALHCRRLRHGEVGVQMVMTEK